MFGVVVKLAIKCGEFIAASSRAVNSKEKGGLDSNTFFLLDSKSIQALKGLFNEAKRLGY